MRARTLVAAAAWMGLATAGCEFLHPRSGPIGAIWETQMVMKDQRVLEVSSDSGPLSDSLDVESLRERPEFVIRGHRIAIEDDQIWLDREPLVEVRRDVQGVTITERHGNLRIAMDGRIIRETELK